MLKSEKGMSKIELVVGIVVVILVVGFSIFLAIGEPKNKPAENNTSNAANESTNTQNTENTENAENTENTENVENTDNGENETDENTTNQ